jgi:regulator of protease activity HflC (stomatin/prohibitin superfamily)
LLEAAGIAKLRSSELADLAIINAEIPLQYTITDVNAYDRLAPPLQRDNLLKAIAVREATLYFQGVNLDEALGHGRRSISDGLRERVQARFDALNPGPDGKPMGAGVKVVFVGISGVHPPKPTASAFELPVQADARRIANIDTARADAEASLVKAAGDASLARKIIEDMNAKDELTTKKADAKLIAAKEDAIARAIEGAGGAAASLLAAARAERWEKHMAMRGRAMRFVGQAKLHDAAPELYRTQQWLDAVVEMLDGAKILIVGGDAGQRRIEVNLEEADLGVDPFLNKQEGE